MWLCSNLLILHPNICASNLVQTKKSWFINFCYQYQLWSWDTVWNRASLGTIFSLLLSHLTISEMILLTVNQSLHSIFMSFTMTMLIHALLFPWATGKWMRQCWHTSFVSLLHSLSSLIILLFFWTLWLKLQFCFFDTVVVHFNTFKF